MSKMMRIRQIAEEVRCGAISFAKGYNKVLNAVKRADGYEVEAYLHNFKTLCMQ